MIYKIVHRTTYRYASPVSVGNHVACLKPRSFPQNHLLKDELLIQPQPSSLTERVDYFGNLHYFFTIEEPHRELIVEARSEVLRGDVRRGDLQRREGKHLEAMPGETMLGDGDLGGHDIPWELSTGALAEEHTPEGLDAYQYQFESPRVRIRPGFAAYALASFTSGRPLRDALMELTTRIHHDFKFDSKVTSVRTTPEEVFKNRRGVCQDFAHVQVACLRSIGLAARYVSGYLRTYPPPGKPRLIGADASHAWISAYCRGTGWLDMDPTNNVAPTDGHVTLAWGRDYGDISPLRGLILGGGSSTLDVSVDMEPQLP